MPIAIRRLSRRLGPILPLSMPLLLSLVVTRLSVTLPGPARAHPLRSRETHTSAFPGVVLTGGRAARPRDVRPDSDHTRYDKLGNRIQKNANGTIDYYGYQDGGHRLQWVNRANNPPTSGQTGPYTLFSYDACGRTTRRDRRYDGGAWHIYDLAWDGDDRLRKATEGGSHRLTPQYKG